MENEAIIHYIKETNEGTTVKRLLISDYNIPQIDRIEKKLDSILETIKEKEPPN